MFAQMQKHLQQAVAVLFLMTAAGRSAMLMDDVQTTATPALSNSPLSTPLDNSTMEKPRVLRSHRSCGSEHENYCGNGGECMYPQDNDKPSCICKPSYSGPRCLFFSVTGETRSAPELEQVIAISFGVFMLILVLAIIVYCLISKRCVKSAQLIKSAPSETSV
ncbi:uncharacterized protein V6R79_011343 [Siganus canaliculatus]